MAPVFQTATALLASPAGCLRHAPARVQAVSCGRAIEPLDQAAWYPFWQQSWRSLVERHGNAHLRLDAELLAVLCHKTRGDHTNRQEC